MHYSLDWHIRPTWCIRLENVTAYNFIVAYIWMWDGILWLPPVTYGKRAKTSMKDGKKAEAKLFRYVSKVFCECSEYDSRIRPIASGVIYAPSL